MQHSLIHSPDAQHLTLILDDEAMLPPLRPGLKARCKRGLRRTRRAGILVGSALQVHSVLVSSLVGLALLAVTGTVIYAELHSSWIEANYVTPLAANLTYRMESGPSASISFPQAGPYDQELGYSEIPTFTQRLSRASFDVESQARLAETHQRLVNAGLFPMFQEKSTHGLRIIDRSDAALYEESYPKLRYAQFADVPVLTVATLLFIEDRQLLGSTLRPASTYTGGEGESTINPAVAWDRLTRASLDLMLDKIFADRNVPGGSTLATQLEKFRHSSGGRTHSARDKIRQMASATARAYLLGRDTGAARQQIVLDYINEVPLGAVSGLGQINGLGEGLKAWYATDLTEVTQALALVPSAFDPAARHRQALAYKRVLALFLSQRRPAFYLQQDQTALVELADTYIRLMRQAGFISAQVAGDALAIDETAMGILPASAVRPKGIQSSFVARKAVNAIRFDVQHLLGVKSLYELDRLDLDVTSTFDKDLQVAVTSYLQSLRTAKGAAAAGVVGTRMLSPEQAAQVNYSFTLVERLADHNAVRVQTDTVEAPLDLNRGGKLELGSTAKLRTLLTYLEMVAEDFRLYAPLAGDPAAIEQVLAGVSSEDEMRLWLLHYLKISGAAATLESTLDAAVKRPFSASPYQVFRTGGGMMRFNNFEHEDNGSSFSIAQGFQRSNNLVFVRVMREVVQHVIFTRIAGAAELLSNPDSDGRRTYLDRFVDMESGDYLRRFYRELRPLAPAERLLRFQRSKHLTTTRLAALLLTLKPAQDYAEFSAQMLNTFPVQIDDKTVKRYFGTMSPEHLSLVDRAYLAHVHPLALWLAAYLDAHPQATYEQALADSSAARQESYGWLYRKASTARRDFNIRTMLEREAFSQHIINYWHKQGFPFATMTPSYASALGSSGDRPAALANLMGAILNDGVMLPTKRIEELRFGRSTPFETVFTPAWFGARRAVAPEVATVARQALLSVVDGGTARRLKGALRRSDGSEIVIAAKTGTGDNRLESFGPGGRLIESSAKSRTATLVFAIGTHYYGTMTAYVTDAGNSKTGDKQRVDGFSFTSSLVVQALKSLLPTMRGAVLQADDQVAVAANN